MCKYIVRIARHPPVVNLVNEIKTQSRKIFTYINKNHGSKNWDFIYSGNGVEIKNNLSVV